MTNSRAKGVRGELEFAAFLTEHGFPARRSQQYMGTCDSGDVLCESLPRIHFEVKRTQAGNPYNWIKQAARDGGAKKPIVAHRRNNEEWIAVLYLEDLLPLLPRAL